MSVLLGFLVSAVGAFILRDVFTQSTQIMDIIPRTVIFVIGVGILLSQLTNLTVSAVRPQKEIDAAGFFNTAKNLGYSIGMRSSAPFSSSAFSTGSHQLASGKPHTLPLFRGISAFNKGPKQKR